MSKSKKNFAFWSIFYWLSNGIHEIFIWILLPDLLVENILVVFNDVFFNIDKLIGRYLLKECVQPKALDPLIAEIQFS